MNKRKLNFFLFLSFIEGGMMLVTELASTRKISVFFGSSLYVWLVVLCITMIGLAAGYFGANYILKHNHKSKNKNEEEILSMLFLVLSGALIVWKFNSNISLSLIRSKFELISAVVIDALILLIVPMFVYGAVTTLIFSLSQKLHPEYPLYGKVLALSTLGSVSFAVIAVLYAFPHIGIQNTIFALSALSLIISFMIYKINWWLVAIFIFGVLYPAEKKLNRNILYQNDGAFSHLMVTEENNTRYLMVNYIIQSFIDYKNNKTLEYADIIDSLLKKQPHSNKKDVLMLGLGGGIVANKIADYCERITCVEIDPRIIECAKKYFNLNKKVTTICDDAQWYIQKEKNKYDVIIMDAFNGEEPPAYLLTQENFYKLKHLLKNDSSLIIINWYGYYSGKTGKGTRILINTLNQSGFYTSHIPTNPNEERSNLLIFASAEKSVLPKNKIKIHFENIINTSDKNILSLLNAEANYKWRRDYLNFIQYWWQ